MGMIIDSITVKHDTFRVIIKYQLDTTMEIYP